MVFAKKTSLFRLMREGNHLSGCRAWRTRAEGRKTEHCPSRALPSLPPDPGSRTWELGSSVSRRLRATKRMGFIELRGSGDPQRRRAALGERTDKRIVRIRVREVAICRFAVAGMRPEGCWRLRKRGWHAPRNGLDVHRKAWYVQRGGLGRGRKVLAFVQTALACASGWVAFGRTALACVSGWVGMRQNAVGMRLGLGCHAVKRRWHACRDGLAFGRTPLACASGWIGIRRNGVGMRAGMDGMRA